MTCSKSEKPDLILGIMKNHIYLLFCIRHYFLVVSVFREAGTRVNCTVFHQGPVVQSPISTNPGLTLNKTYKVNPGLALIGL